MYFPKDIISQESISHDSSLLNSYGTTWQRTVRCELPKSLFLFKRCTSFLHLFADVIDFEARYIKIWCILLCKQKRINMLKRIPAFGRRFVRTDWKLRNSKSESIFEIIISTDSSQDPIKITISDSVATLELNNPPVNVLSRKVLEEGFHNDAFGLRASQWEVYYTSAEVYYLV